MKKYFIRYLYPGLIFSDSREVETDMTTEQWARKLVPRELPCQPFAFQYVVRERGEQDLDSRVTETSGRYYFGGEVFTLADIEARKFFSDRILIENMKCNGYAKVIITGRQAQHFADNDTRLEPLEAWT